MSVVVSLLRAIDRADGEALVMHVGEKPYVVTANGHAELGAKELTIPAMTGMLEQLLPPESRQALEDVGAVEHHLPPQDNAPGLRYSIVAARGGDDIWIEVRRRKVQEPTLPEAVPAPIHVAAAEPQLYALETSGPIAVPDPPVATVAELEVLENPAHAAAPVMVASPAPDIMLMPEPEFIAMPEPELVAMADQSLIMAPEAAVVAMPEPEFLIVPEPEPAATPEPELVAVAEPETIVAIAEPEPAAVSDPGPVAVSEPEPIVIDPEPEPVFVLEPIAATPNEEQVDEPIVEVVAEPSVVLIAETSEPEPGHRQPHLVVTETQPVAESEAPATPASGIEERAEAESEDDEDSEREAASHHAVVVPIGRSGPRVESAPRSSGREGLHHLLQFAAAQGSSVLYVSSKAKPSLRVDGEIRVLEHETTLTEAQLEAGLHTILPGAQSALGEMQTCDVPDVGRVQCLTFRDHRGLGAMFRMLPARAISSELIGLGAPIQALCTETEGLILVSGGRGSGKSTLVAALVDQMNRTRRDHIVTVEHQIQFVHDNRSSFVSQREARDEDAFAESVRSALREAPDVLVIDQVMSAEVATFALHAASNGHLVVAAVMAASTGSALGRFVEFFGDDRAHARATLGEHLRGVITQTLLRKAGGGRAAAREVLVNVPSVSTLVVEGQYEQLASVLNGGRRVGMVPLNDALLGLVQSGTLDVREAYRKSPDQDELVTLLNREGLDTTFAERLA